MKDFLFLLLFFSIFTEAIKPLQCCATEPNRPTLLAHYMPWYSSKSVSGSWGWHWTMDHFDPDKVSGGGKREIASHDYPLMGAYDSSDPHALECQVIQMKLAGINGVIIDWYGIRDYFDYAAIHANTQALIPFLQKAGLQFVICYEDQSIGHMIKGGEIKASDGVREAKLSLQWLEENWFSHPSYLRKDDQPVLIVFGPQYFDEESWKETLSFFDTKPRVHLLPHLAKKYKADGPFGWIPVHGGNSLAPNEWRESLDRLYRRADDGENVMGIAFPGYDDIYAKAGIHDSYGSIDSRGGKTFIETLDRAYESSSDIIQIATWNDYGEGTVIEPARNFGYQFLEEVQRRAFRTKGNTPKEFSTADLRLPLQLFHLREEALNKGSETMGLDRVSKHLFSGEVEEARVLLDQWEAGR